jgi:hypothetical protein
MMAKFVLNVDMHPFRDAIKRIHIYATLFRGGVRADARQLLDAIQLGRIEINDLSEISVEDGCVVVRPSQFLRDLLIELDADLEDVRAAVDVPSHVQCRCTLPMRSK